MRERFFRHVANADVVRQELASEQEIVIGLRSVERWVQGWRRELKAHKRATVHSETRPSDGGQLASLLDKGNTASPVWGDTAYRSRRNERHLARHGFISKVPFRRKPGCAVSPREAQAHAARSKGRSAVETVVAAQKHGFGLVVRTVGLARASVTIGLADLTSTLRLTSNLRRLV